VCSKYYGSIKLASKKYKGKTCVYCRERESATADHVFSREFFQVDQRDLLPKVPSCEICNNEKSKLEHYLTAVLPFGATHKKAEKALTIDVKKRLDRNKKLHNQLHKSLTNKNLKLSEGRYEKRLTLDVNFKDFNRLISFIGKGLMWHHFNKLLPLNSSERVFSPSPSGVEYISNFFNLETKHRVNETLGEGTVRYKGIMSETDEGVSIWAIQLLGGITISDTDSEYVFKNSFVAMFTGSNDFLEGLKLTKT
jgi:hypothetical protein